MCVGAFGEDTLSSSWRTFLYAVEEALTAEATRAVELQAENEALKAGMRNFKQRAQYNAQKLKALSTSRSRLPTSEQPWECLVTKHFCSFG